MNSSKFSKEELAMVERYRAHQEYQKAYNQRPEVKAKRSQYNKNKWAKMREAREILKQEGLL